MTRLLLSLTLVLYNVSIFLSLLDHFVLSFYLDLSIRFSIIHSCLATFPSVHVKSDGELQGTHGLVTTGYLRLDR